VNNSTALKFLQSTAALLLCLGLAACASKKLDKDLDDPAAKVEQVDTLKRANLRMQLAVGYYQQGQHKVALEEIRQALAATPDLVDAYSLRALIFMEMGDKHLAEENFQRAIQLSPNNADILNNYAWFLCQNGREKQGVGLFEKVLKDPAYPNPVKTLTNAGICSLKQGDNRAAEQFLTAAFRMDPGNILASSNLAKVYFDKKDYENARFHVNRVLKAEVMTADVLWLAIKIEKKVGDEAALASLTTQLRRRHPGSREFQLLQRGAFDE